jgi:hypothetical protein
LQRIHPSPIVDELHGVMERRATAIEARLGGSED